jgi:hypothetical protein
MGHLILGSLVQLHPIIDFLTKKTHATCNNLNQTIIEFA